MSELLDITQIMRLIPHRYPFLLVDKIIEFKINEYIIGIKNVTFNEPYFIGHFPSRPIMPGVLIIEAMAQVAAVLVAKSTSPNECKDEDKDIYFMSIESAKFRKIVTPGDTLHIYCKLEQNRAQVWKFTANAKVADQLVTESKFTAMVKKRN